MQRPNHNQDGEVGHDQPRRASTTASSYSQTFNESARLTSAPPSSNPQDSTSSVEPKIKEGSTKVAETRKMFEANEIKPNKPSKPKHPYDELYFNSEFITLEEKYTQMSHDELKGIWETYLELKDKLAKKTVVRVWELNSLNRLRDKLREKFETFQKSNPDAVDKFIKRLLEPIAILDPYLPEILENVKGTGTGSLNEGQIHGSNMASKTHSQTSNSKGFEARQRPTVPLLNTNDSQGHARPSKYDKSFQEEDTTLSISSMTSTSTVDLSKLQKMYSENYILDYGNHPKTMTPNDSRPPSSQNSVCLKDQFSSMGRDRENDLDQQLNQLQGQVLGLNNRCTNLTQGLDDVRSKVDLRVQQRLKPNTVTQQFKQVEGALPETIKVSLGQELLGGTTNPFPAPATTYDAKDVELATLKIEVQLLKGTIGHLVQSNWDVQGQVNFLGTENEKLWQQLQEERHLTKTLTKCKLEFDQEHQFWFESKILDLERKLSAEKKTVLGLREKLPHHDENEKDQERTVKVKFNDKPNYFPITKT